MENFGGDGLNGQVAFIDPNDQLSLISPDSSEWLLGTDPSLSSLSGDSLTAEGVPLDIFNLASLSSDPLNPSFQAPLDNSLNTVPDITAFMDGSDDGSLQANLFLEDPVGK